MNHWSILMKRVSCAAVVGLLTFAALATTSHPAFADAPAAIVNGGGHGTLTDPDGNTFPIRFAIAANVTNDGDANGHINFVFRGEMADVWSAVPGVVDFFHVYGQVTAGSVAADGTVILQGTVTEIDFDEGNGRIFIVKNDSFVIVTGGSVGGNAFDFTYCLLPTWNIAVTSGNVHLH